MDHSRNFFHAVAGADFKVKDLRTWKANSIAMDELSKIDHSAAATDAGFKKIRHQVADRVAEALGNTRDVALKSYIDPTVFSMWRDEAVSPLPGPATVSVQPRLVRPTAAAKGKKK